ncbi:hypothetical protein S-MbCM25_092 [Synechococcus phage S-MbCM25]|uniref:DUF6321 domain-containing protein n=2 Tax=Synechococcus phage ACG-2014c TaxID=1079998 RepID=V5UT62_9CAUD|nr:hypothetical protein S-MbCM25_092 [Synechococcus phage S-MbCM25]AIX22859.1 hypothetical protein Syn7803C98_91 [Synechococcus phage ACG-2014c]AIX38092.1 hypothetical protein Syn7803US88_91 [Synechococcus phage ACG-2014c]
MSKGFASDIPPALNGTAKKYIRGMMKGKNRWNKLYGSRSKEVMHKTANKMAMGEMSKMPPTYNDLFGEANKSGDDSLHDWFNKSKSSDGKKGWVQMGGKFAGKPCAKQPGQTTKPKCGSSKMKRNLNKGEEEAAFRRKNAEDPNPDRKGKAKNVKTEENILERADMWHPDPEKDKKLGGPGANARAREDGASSKPKPKEDPKKLKKGESYMDYSKRQKASRQKSGTATSRLNAMGANIKPKKKSLLGRLGLRKEDVVNEKAGEKDACYKKVKASAKVWPSAYASGRLVQCRKKGAANYGNKSEGMTFQQVQEKCWQGYKRVGMKKKGNKMVPNCVPEEVQTEGAAWTKKSGKNSEGGLNEKGRKSYEKENPGSDLKAPSKKVGNPRRASFCARMKGMRKRQKPSNNTGDDRLSKSLRAWNC